VIQARRLYRRKSEDMRMIKQLRSFWILWVATIVLACFSDAVAQTSYKVTDLGRGESENEACAMSVNDEGWTEIMTWNGDPAQNVNFIQATLLSGRALIDANGFKLDLGTLGGKNSWMNWGEINNFGQIVGLSETADPDPNGEDICGFGTHLTCRPFLWQDFHMSALPTLGGNNGQASAINIRGQIVGMAEKGTVDSSCSPDTTNNRIQLPVLWENGRAHALPTAGRDPDGFAFWINDHGQAVGTSGTCGGATSHAVSWENDTVSPLPDLGTGAIAYGINNRGQIVGSVFSPDGTTRYGALWQNGVLTNLWTLPGDLAAIATGINDQGHVVGSTWDSNFNWSHAFIYQDSVMTDLNTLFPDSSNLFATMANKINNRGQISGMAIVRSGPDKGHLHAFLATPVNESIGRSVADDEPTRPGSNLPSNVGKQVLQRFGLGRIER
jgi:probable HAF family extracellular repeat protein